MPSHSNGLVTVVVLNAFSTEDLHECLNSVVRTDYSRYEIIVVDYKSPGIDTLIHESFPGVKLVSLDRDIGPSAMHNEALKASNDAAQFVAFLDNDTVVEADWLKKLMECISADPGIGAVQSRILIHNMPDILNTEGNLANFLALGWPAGYGSSSKEADLLPVDIDFASGAAMIIRKEALRRIGLYDEDYFIYADDLDVGLRLLLAGYRILNCPFSVVHHKYKFLRSRRSYFFLNRNRLYTFLKLYDRKTYILMMPAIAMLESFALGYAFLEGYIVEMGRAYAQVLVSLRDIVRKRAKVKQYKILSDAQIVGHLEGGIDFAPLTESPLVRYVLNPFLESYKRFVMDSLEGHQ